MSTRTCWMRTVKWWVRYIPNQGLVCRVYRTKKKAAAAQKGGEVIFQVKGHFFPAEVKKLRSRP